MRVVVLGAGYAGVVLARRLERRLPDDVELVVVDDTGEHLVQHELHRVVRRPAFADDITVRIDDLFDRAKTHRATVDSIDRDERVVHFEESDELAYDVAAICLGAETAHYDLPGIEAHGTPLKRLPHAATIRSDFLDVLNDGGGTVVVGGAGLSGVQTAGELAALARENDAGVSVDVLLVEQLPNVASSFPKNFRTAVRDELDREGVWVRTDATITRATDSEIHVERGDAISYDQFVWTGGIRGTAALGGKRPDVRADLAMDERTFALGDAARVLGAEGTMVPASAQTAVREARVVARNIETVVADRRDSGGFRPRLDRYTFDSPGWAVSVGDSAVAQIGPTVFRGATANALKSSIGLRYLASAGAVRDAIGLLGDEFDVDTDSETERPP